MRAPFLIAAALLAASAVSAEDLGAIVSLSGETPVLVRFWKCGLNKREAATDTTPLVCHDRDSRDTFFAVAVRVTNLGDTVVWVHLGDDKVPVLPRTAFDVWGTPKVRLNRVFLSANPEEAARAHVFASETYQPPRPFEPMANERNR